MDTYTKFVLTVIALALSLMAAKEWAPREAHAALFGGPTVGEFKAAKAAERKAIIDRMPMIYVWEVRNVRGGSIEIDR